MHVPMNYPETSYRNWKIKNVLRNGMKFQVLMEDDIVKMSNMPEIVEDFKEFLSVAKGHILINGLGMGMCNVYLLKKDNVDSLTVIEYNKELIHLIAPFFEDNPKCTIIHADALEYIPPEGKLYDYVWHDIWTLQSASNVKDIESLKDKYNSIAHWQGAWREEACTRQLQEHN